MVDELGLSKSKPVTTPVVVDRAYQCRDGEVRPLDGEEKLLYQRLVANSITWRTTG